MGNYICQPRMTRSGVAFTVVDGASERECLISRETLEKVALLKNVDASGAEPMEIFHAFEETIDVIARRVIASSAFSPLVLLRPESFQ